MFCPRETALVNFWCAERRAGSTPLETYERMEIYAERLDALYAAQLQAVKTEMEQS